MKRILTSALCATLVLLPVQQSKSYLLPAAICCAVVAAGVATVVIVIKNCQPTYYCVQDTESKQQWCRITTRKEIDMESDWKYIAGPYKSEQECTDRCNQTNAPTSLITIATGEYVTIEKSHDLKSWLVAGTAEGTINSFEWAETNSVSSTPIFYRVRY